MNMSINYDRRRVAMLDWMLSNETWDDLLERTTMYYLTRGSSEGCAALKRTFDNHANLVHGIRRRTFTWPDGTLTGQVRCSTADDSQIAANTVV
ncbi:hypothetical protein ACH4D3_40735 [Streptomyces sp. NPDC018026]|uniref:hypothetical protein n=1 Tax=Streptomyces sp. NPDC018026 TaxID=3365031 RepID=UPI00379D9E81